MGNLIKMELVHYRKEIQYERIGRRKVKLGNLLLDVIFPGNLVYISKADFKKGTFIRIKRTSHLLLSVYTLHAEKISGKASYAIRGESSNVEFER